MDDLTKHRLLKTGHLTLHGTGSPSDVHDHVREAAGLLGVTGRSIRTQVEGVAGRMVLRSFVPFGWGDPEFEPDDAVVKCIGYELAAFELFQDEQCFLLYLDSALDTVGQHRRIEVRDGAVVEVCRADLLNEGDVAGLVNDQSVPAHPLSKLLGSPLRWFVRSGDESVFGFGSYAFHPSTGNVARGGEGLRQEWSRTFDEGQSSTVPVLLGHEASRYREHSPKEDR